MNNLTGIDVIVMQDSEAMIRLIQERRRVQGLPCTREYVIALLERTKA